MKTINIPFWVWDCFAIIGIATFILLCFCGIGLIFIKKRQKPVSTDLVETFDGKADNNGSS